MNQYYFSILKSYLTINDFFSKKVALQILKKIGYPDIITFTNVFAHINDLNNLLDNLKIIIGQNTKIVIENHYLGSILEYGQFDTFYHEHARTYSFESFLHISKLLNLDIIKVSFPKRYGGNIRIFLRKKSGKNKISFSKIKKKENNFLKEFSNMRKNIKIWKVKKRKEILFYYKKYGKISAKSFPGRAAILIKTLGIDEKIISAVYEKSNSLKIGNCVPATKIPIISDELFFENKLEEKIIINFAWHISAEINNYMRMRGFKGKILDIIGKNDFA
jgi:hypothetical protein